MTNASDSPSADDPYDLSRFVRAQEDVYEQAFSEIMHGQKRTHWIWYIFLQIDGLAFGTTSKRYSIKSECAIGHAEDGYWLLVSHNGKIQVHESHGSIDTAGGRAEMLKADLLKKGWSEASSSLAAAAAGRLPRSRGWNKLLGARLPEL